MNKVKLLYLHGLESGPYADKAQTLRAADAGEAFEVVAPQLTTARLVALRAAEPVEGGLAEALAEPFAQARAAYLEAEPAVVVGSSFGGALLLMLVHDPVWRPETAAVFLAQAGLRLTERATLPPGVRAVVVHGTDDTVIPVADSRALAASSAEAVYVEVTDEHRLQRVTRSGMLTALVRLALTAPAPVPAPEPAPAVE